MHFDWFLYKKSLNICETLLYYYQDINQQESVKKITGNWPNFCVITGFLLLKIFRNNQWNDTFWFIFHKKKWSNICKNLQHYSQDVNYYETVKKVHKKVIKNFYHLTTCTLPVYSNQMNRASLSYSSLLPVQKMATLIKCTQLSEFSVHNQVKNPFLVTLYAYQIGEPHAENTFGTL